MSTLASPAGQKSIIERVHRLRPDAPAVWGRMNASQMICHVNDSFLTSFGERTVSPASTIFHRTVMKWIALKAFAPWPKGLKTRPEVEQGVGGTCPTDFATDRDDLIRTIERFCAPDRQVGRHPHPIFGLMSVSEWMRWGYLHADHHLRQFGV
jgi:hypothetical protein